MSQSLLNPQVIWYRLNPLPESEDAVQVQVGVGSVVADVVDGVPGLVGAVVSDDPDVFVTVFVAVLT